MLHMPRIRSLETRHAHLEERIAQEGARPRPDDGILTRLKREKLQLKEEMERLKRPN
ncbi:MAG: YdcH family protein [Acetobacteraceae bacterium]|nr:YdcH family protein [Acetobacteraceae bacterium]